MKGYCKFHPSKWRIVLKLTSYKESHIQNLKIRMDIFDKSYMSAIKYLSVHNLSACWNIWLHDSPWILAHMHDYWKLQMKALIVDGPCLCVTCYKLRMFSIHTYNFHWSWNIFMDTNNHKIVKQKANGVPGTTNS